MPYKWRDAFIMSSFRWKFAYLMHIPLETSLVARCCIANVRKKSRRKLKTFFLTFLWEKK